MGGDVTNWIYGVATWLVPLTIAIVFHEVAHGRVARWFGDMTAAEQGRLSFNPLKHVDPLGTVIVPMGLALSGLPVFGWAKPVPVSRWRMRNPRWNMVAVAAAGPAMNILLAIGAALAIGLFARFIPTQHESLIAFLDDNLTNFVAVNLFLAVFNMIPLPPFDGSKVLGGVLPPSIGERYQSMDRFAIPVMLVLLLVLPRLSPSLDVVRAFVLPPVMWLFAAMQAIAGAVAG